MPHPETTGHCTTKTPHVEDLRSPSLALLSQGFSREKHKALLTLRPLRVSGNHPPQNPYYLEELLRLGMVPKACEEARFCPASDSSSSERLAVPDAIRDESSSP